MFQIAWDPKSGIGIIDSHLAGVSDRIKPNRPSANFVLDPSRQDGLNRRCPMACGAYQQDLSATKEYRHSLPAKLVLVLIVVQ